MLPITIDNIGEIELDKLPRGAHMVMDGDQPVAVLMSAEYYAYIQSVLKETHKLVKDKVSG